MKKILILTANPTNTQTLRLNEEVRNIENAQERSQKRDEFKIIVKQAVRQEEFRRHLLDHKPDIVHFSGHGGGEQGLALMGDNGEAILVKPDALTDFFEIVQRSFKIECVVLNACYSEIQAEGIYPYVDYVVGMNQKIGDKAAREFTLGFYDALFANESIETAFKLGCNAIQMKDIPEHLTPILKNRTNLHSQSVLNSFKDISLESFDGQVPLNSRFYIERPNIESNCYQTILEPGALIRIKAPKKMGKTSLMSRILNHGVKQGYQKVSIDLWSPEILTDISTFLQWFCALVSEELNLEIQLEKYWKRFLTNQQNCSKYFSDYLLTQITQPIVLGLDDIDEIFSYPQIAGEFFKLLRSWNEKGKNSDVWQKLRIVIAHSQEVYIQLDANHSPFNVGSSFELGEFNQLQIKELIKRHGLNWSEQEIQKLIDMIDGHPYLLRVALYYLAKGQINLDDFLKNAPTEAGLYRDHFSKYLSVLEDNENLKIAMKKVVESDTPVQLDAKIAFKLRSLGLVEAKENKVIPLCNLYRLYFLDRLSN
ncbi:AAA-like domain-containing protein [Anabaena cylindrica UHCC 0172]|uniref:AAA-like domain-containing protein n=1 Tax=Anabaena cylindrica TaxID=1165 RepID=UPI002B21B698|nr:AAA-like domain-containing protein [Anabaena cylindrica]MEA5553043.1 AAA-like domain-containing protein [Anabaena cylindrica UHCC 0172]